MNQHVSRRVHSACNLCRKICNLAGFRTLHVVCSRISVNKDQQKRQQSVPLNFHLQDGSTPACVETFFSKTDGNSDQIFFSGGIMRSTTPVFTATFLLLLLSYPLSGRNSNTKLQGHRGKYSPPEPPLENFHFLFWNFMEQLHVTDVISAVREVVRCFLHCTGTLRGVSCPWLAVGETNRPVTNL